MTNKVTQEELDLMGDFARLMEMPEEEREAKIKNWATVNNARAWASTLNLNILKRVPRSIADKDTCETVDRFAIALGRLNRIPRQSSDS